MVFEIVDFSITPRSWCLTLSDERGGFTLEGGVEKGFPTFEHTHFGSLSVRQITDIVDAFADDIGPLGAGENEVWTSYPSVMRANARL